jgi:hypothetical protein
MGHSFKATCKDCQLNFVGSEGGGFFFHDLRCDCCGESTSIGFDTIGEPHLRYVKGLQVPYCIASSEADEIIRASYPGDSITEEQYHEAVEQLAGACPCGGRFKFDAPIRCPRCRSSHVDPGDLLMMYD